MKKSLFLNPHKPEIRKPGRKTLALSNAAPADLLPCVNMAVKTTQASLSAAASLGFSNLVSGKAEGDFFFFLFEAAATSPTVVPEVDGKIQYGVVYGSGMRVGVLAEKASASSEVNLAGLAAAASVEGVSTSIEAQYFGLQTAAISELGDILGISSGTEFDSSFLVNLGKATTVLASQFANLDLVNAPQPLEYSELLSNVNYTYLHAISTSYALHRLTKGDGYNDAIDRLVKKIQNHDDDYYYEGVNETLVASVYNQIMDGDLYSDPSHDQEDAAHAIYDIWPTNSDH